MSTPLLTSDPAVALELGRRLALNAQRSRKETTRLGQAWQRWLGRATPKPAERHR